MQKVHRSVPEATIGLQGIFVLQLPSLGRSATHPKTDTNLHCSGLIGTGEHNCIVLILFYFDLVSCGQQGQMKPRTRTILFQGTKLCSSGALGVGKCCVFQAYECAM